MLFNQVQKVHFKLMPRSSSGSLDERKSFIYILPTVTVKSVEYDLLQWRCNDSFHTNRRMQIIDVIPPLIMRNPHEAHLTVTAISVGWLN